MNTRSLSIDYSTWARGHQFTAEELMCLYETDFLMKFAIDGMIEDAVRKWLKDFKEPNEDSPIVEKLANVMKWGDLFGDAIAVLLQEATDDGQIKDTKLLKNKITGTWGKDLIAVGIDVFHPLCDGDGYEDPSSADLDALGNPTVFHVHIKNVTGTIDIDASRVVIFKGRGTRRNWRGLCEVAGSIDDLVDYRKWRAAYGKRAGAIANPGYFLDKKDINAKWSDTEKTSVDNAFGEDNCALLTGDIQHGTIEPPLAIGEIDSTALALINAVAVDLGVQLNDIFERTGSGQQFAPDSNQATYFIAIAGRQKRHEFPLKRLLKAFKIKWTAWNSAWEESLQSQTTNENALANAYNNSTDPEIRAILKADFVTRYGEKVDYTKYLAEERASEERSSARLDAFARGGGTKRPDSGDGDSGRGDTSDEADSESAIDPEDAL
jgi:hypothetical protein